MKLYLATITTTYVVTADTEDRARVIAARAECLLTPPDKIELSEITSAQQIPEEWVDETPFGSHEYISCKHIINPPPLPIEDKDAKRQ